MLKAYLADNTNVVNTDEARKLFADIGYNGNNSAAVHEASSAVANAALAHFAKTRPKGDVFFLAGSSGAGKSSVTRGPMKEAMDKAAFTFDGNLSNYDSAKKKIKMVESHGHTVTVPYIYRDPIEAWRNGVISRMLDSSTDLGRVVPLSVFMENLTGSLKTVKRLIDDGVPVAGYENKVDRSIDELSIDDIRKISFPEDLESKLRKMTENLAKEGKISAEQRASLLDLTE